MAKTRHIQTRMNQRGIDQALLSIVSGLGATIQSDGAEKHILSKKGVDNALKRLDRYRAQLLKVRDKGGLVLVEGDEGVQITAYRLNSYRRPGGKR